MIASRRTFLAGLGATLAAPAVIRTPGLLMPVRAIIPPTPRFYVGSELDLRQVNVGDIFCHPDGSMWVACELGLISGFRRVDRLAQRLVDRPLPLLSGAPLGALQRVA